MNDEMPKPINNLNAEAKQELLEAFQKLETSLNDYEQLITQKDNLSSQKISYNLKIAGVFLASQALGLVLIKWGIDMNLIFNKIITIAYGLDVEISSLIFLAINKMAKEIEDQEITDCLKLTKQNIKDKLQNINKKLV